MAEPFIGQITLFAGDFAPQGWARCDGQLLPISQYTALFSLIGNRYGGDGRSNFALPDLKGHTPIGAGQGPGLSQRALGTSGGQEKVALSQAQMPAHAHQAQCDNGGAGAPSPTDSFWAKAQGDEPYVGGENPAGIDPMSAHSLAANGGGQPHNNMQPYLTLTFIIALQGMYPFRG